MLPHLSVSDCERIGTSSVADLTHEEIEYLPHNGSETLREIADIAARQEPPNIALLGLLKAVCSQQESNSREYRFGGELREALEDKQVLRDVIDAHIRRAEQASGQQG